MLQYFFVFLLFQYATADCVGITRPCPDNCLSCIRKYFAENAQCTIPVLEAPETVAYSYPWTILYGSVNTTVVYHRLSFTTACFTILDFYINSVTDKAVLTVEFSELKVVADPFDFHFHRVCQEPATSTSNAQLIFNPIVVTATIPNVRNLQLSNAFFATFCDGGLASIQQGPLIAYGVDTQCYFDKFMSDLPNRVRYFLYYTMAFVFKAYVKYHICDFDVPPSC